MGIRLFLRSGRHRAERDLAAGLVQEARLDLSRPAALAGLSLLVAVGWAAGANAQKLLPDGPLTTLLQPQKLDRSRPLLPPEPLAGARPDGQGAIAGRPSPCERGSARRDPVPPPRGGGSGPGDFGRYMPGGAPATGSAIAAPGAPAPPSRAPGADRPLLAGTDRPLWATGERPPSAGRTKPDSPADASGAGAAASGTQDGVAVPGRDRPLWADGTMMGQADPARGVEARESAESSVPCIGRPVPLVR